MIGTVYPLILLTLPQSIVLNPYWMNTGKISFMIVIYSNLYNYLIRIHTLCLFPVIIIINGNDLDWSSIPRFYQVFIANDGVHLV